MGKNLNLSQHFIAEKRKKRKWAMLTAYDAPTAELLENAGVDLILVGDSLGMVLLGYASTAPVTMEEMIHHAKAVRRGARKAFIIGDLPLKGIKKGPRQALASAKRFVMEAGCDAVKLEWNPKALRMTRLMRRHGIPVMGHVGLTPQTVRPQNGFRVQGQAAENALEILRIASRWEKEGIFMLLLECVPAPVAQAVTRTLKIPTIGIGAGTHCDGQVLVFHDMVGIFRKLNPRFVKRYASLEPLMQRAVRRYIQEVREGKFPRERHSFRMKEEELEKFKSAARGKP